MSSMGQPFPGAAPGGLASSTGTGGRTAGVASYESVPTFVPARVFKGYPATVTSLNFHRSGLLCVATADDDSIRLFDVKEARESKTVFSKKYGAHAARFMHGTTCIIHASTKDSDTIRYHSLHDNAYIRFLKGHTDRVLSIDVSPVDDQFLSTSLDGTVRIWDVKSPGRQRGCMTLGSKGTRTSAAYDPEGLCYAVSANSGSILMYDARQIDKGPFLTFNPLKDAGLRVAEECHWTSLQFSSDGKYIIVGTADNIVLVIDAFSGQLQLRLVGVPSLDARLGERGRGSEVAITPDVHFVLAGSHDGSIRVWDLKEGLRMRGLTRDVHPLITMDGHDKPVRALAFNPVYMMMASASDVVAFWSTSQDSDS